MTDETGSKRRFASLFNALRASGSSGSAPAEPMPSHSAAAPAFNALGEVLVALGEQQAAIAAFDKAVKLAPGDATFRRNLDSSKR